MAMVGRFLIAFAYLPQPPRVHPDDVGLRSHEDGLSSYFTMIVPHMPWGPWTAHTYAY